MEYTDLTPDNEREIFQVSFVIELFSTMVTFPFREYNWVWHLLQRVRQRCFQLLMDTTLNGACRETTGDLRCPGRLC